KSRGRFAWSHSTALQAPSPPTGGEGQDEGARFMVREHLQKLDVNRSHEPWRSGVSAERRNSWEQQPAALCRDAATGRRFMDRLKLCAEPACRTASGFSQGKTPHFPHSICV